MVMLEYHCSVQKEYPSHQDSTDEPHDVLSVERVLPNNMLPQVVTVALQRTIRVPDVVDNDNNNDSNDSTSTSTNGHPSALPPGLGYFPIYKTKDYTSRLPKDMALNGGVFVPMYQREAMWLRFQATSPFKVRIYAGGVNAVTGTKKEEEEGERERRCGWGPQDYVVVPEQLWLDGVAAAAEEGEEQGAVRQFVAMPVGTGYTVEAQVTGADVRGGLQVEVTPARRWPVPAGYRLFVRTLEGRLVSVVCDPGNRVADLNYIVSGRAGDAERDARVIYGGKQLCDDMTLGECGVENFSTLHLLHRLRGGASGPSQDPDKNTQLGIAAGGKIRQTICRDPHWSTEWLDDLTFTFPIHLLNSSAFRAATGLAPPPTPVSAATYALAGLPFFNYYDEEHSSVPGWEDPQGLKSVAQVESHSRLASGYGVDGPGMSDEAREPWGHDAQRGYRQGVVDMYPRAPNGSFVVRGKGGEAYTVHNPDCVLKLGRSSWGEAPCASIEELEAGVDGWSLNSPDRACGL